MATLLLVLVLAQENAAKLVERLRSDSIEEREEATRQLRRLGPRALPAVEGILKDPDREVAERARFVTRAIRNRERLPEALLKAAPEIEDRLARGPDSVWGEVLLDLIGQMNRREASDSLTQELLEPLVVPAFEGGGSPRQMESLCLVALQFRCRAAAPHLVRCLSDPNPQVRVWAREALIHIHSPEHFPKVATLLKSADVDVRDGAAEVLIRGRAREAVPFLLERLKAPESLTRAEAIQALGEIGDRSAIPAVASRLTDEALFVRGSALRALGQLGSHEHAEAIVRMLDNGDSNEKWFAIQGLGGLRRMEDVPRLLPFLASKDVDLRWAAHRALASIGDRAVLFR